jgi:hypothetical protein
MRRSLLGLGVLVLVLLLGAYAAFWWIVAGRIEDGVAAWAESLRRQNTELTWRTIRVGGFPFAFDIRLNDARLRNNGKPGGELRAPAFSASAHPWDFHAWRLAAPDGLRAGVGPPGEPITKLQARSGTGAVSVADNGESRIWFTLEQADAELPEHVAADFAHFWAVLPQKPPQEHTDRTIGLAAELRGLAIPALPPQFRGAIDELGLGATVLGAIPAGPPRQAAAGWRDSGGTVELDNFTLRRGDLLVHGSGTMALGPDLQPLGAFSGGVSGLDELLNAFAAAGQLRMGDLVIARLGLAALAQPGPNGKPEVSTSFTLQNGQMYLGPLKLGPAPRIDW